MATFVVLPPLECLEQAATDFFARVLPGVQPPDGFWEDVFAKAGGEDVFFVHREDLGGGDVADELADEFGAEPGDAVMEVGLASGLAAAPIKAWAIPAGVSVGAISH